MKVRTIVVRYGETRSYRSSYGNKKVEVELTADLEPGENQRVARRSLLESAQLQVRAEFGDDVEDPEKTFRVGTIPLELEIEE
jgi:hypothetical protein